MKKGILAAVISIIEETLIAFACHFQIADY
jgi:hypothetical protein